MSVRRKKERLPVALGRELRACREREGISAVDLARAARISGGTLSKIEHGTITASLTIIQSLSRNLGVSLATLMRRAEESRNALFVRRNEVRAAAGSIYQGGLFGFFLGSINLNSNNLQIQSSIFVLKNEDESFKLVQNKGDILIYMLDGGVIYRYGSNLYELISGDSLFFDAECPHGPDRILKVPSKILKIH